MDYHGLTPIQLDALREVGNIGAGNAATALSQLLNKKIQMSVPSIDIINFQDMIDNYAENEAVGVMVRVLGDTPGNILFLLEKGIATDIIELLTGKHEEEFSDLGISVLNELGNIVSTSYMNSIAKFTNMNLLPSVPAMAYDMVGAILSTMFIEAAQYEDRVLEIKTNFWGISSLSGEESFVDNIGANFYYVPRPGSLEKILTALGVN